MPVPFSRRVTSKAFAASIVAEALANYGHADDPLLSDVQISTSDETFDFRDDAAFWRTSSKFRHGARVEFYAAVISEWVARVPGLFWKNGSSARREPTVADIESRTGRFITLRPTGKSRVVSGGIGTLRFPPSEAGYRLATLTMSNNASSGVPVLISPEVWERHRLTEGTLIGGEGTWQPLPYEWSDRFPTIANLNRACLAIETVDSIHVLDTGVPVEVHPFSIMSYEENGALFYDFVYATAQTLWPGMRTAVASFFRDYCRAERRFGSYLTGADIVDPLWTATYSSPEDLRRASPAEVSLLEARIAEAMSGDNTINQLVRHLSRHDARDIVRIAASIGISPGLLDFNGAVARQSMILVEGARQRDKLPALWRFLAEEDGQL